MTTDSAWVDLYKRVDEGLLGSRSLAGLHQSDTAFLLAVAAWRDPGIHLVVCANNREAERLANDLRFFSMDLPVHVLPGIEADPYRGLSPHPEIAERRVETLWRLLTSPTGIFITTGHSLLARLPTPENFLSGCLQLETGGFFPSDHLLAELKDAGYVREDPVTEIGEYSSRGGIVDIYSAARENPVRIEYFGDEIESIREFDPSTQRSIQLIPSCWLIPAREWVIRPRDIQRWHDQAPEYFTQVRFAEALAEKRQFTGDGELFNGFEYLLSLVVECGSSLLDYAASRSDSLKRLYLYRADVLLQQISRRREHLEASYQQRQQDGELVLPPGRLFLGYDEIERWFEEKEGIRIEDLALDLPSDAPLDFQLERRYHTSFREIIDDLRRWRQKGEQVVFVMASRGKAERLSDIFREYDVTVPLIEGGFHQAVQHPLSVTEGRLAEGFYSRSLQLHVLTQQNVFEEAPAAPAPKKPAPQHVPGAFLSDFRDLKSGDYVVHVEHGIGHFKGLKKIGVGADEKEFVELSYQKGAKLYVPVDRLDLLQKYSGATHQPPQLDRLGGVSWQRTKKRIRKAVRELAEDLLKLYAQRELAEGHACSADDAMMREFEEAFEFEETLDQKYAIRDVKSDLESPRPMDRLICGDVGYGKTEVAMRAAFKVVNDSRQVAILAPTTVLAFQHYTTLRERFQGFPVNVEMISRFRSRAEQQEIVQKCSSGLIDILIGTHRLLSKDIQFQKLGLIVVDEEQRFGVSQKEKLKKLKTKVDVLTLSATPIPRTLNMSMLGLRDLSIIETPPKDRLAIQTVVVKFSRNIIRSAIDLELKREGQVFFVHNSVETIQTIASMVQEIVPEARVCVGHGQMRESELEEVMLDFLNYRYDVLVCTTIIENGLDIPRANTLIVNRADHFGLSQLYQLRGRVGRASRRAYAYLMIPTEEILTTRARKRLQAIREFSDLGAGFRIAALDLEIRGAGNLLGAEQHGNINSIGLEMYMKLLEQTVQELRGEPVVEEIETSINLRMDIHIPDHYIADANIRLWLYKRISVAGDESKLENLKAETIDRFGRYPRSVSNLFAYAALRLRARRLRISSIDRKGPQVLIKFLSDTPIAPQKLVAAVHQSSGMALSPDGVLSLLFAKGIPEKALVQELEGALSGLAMLE